MLDKVFIHFLGAASTVTGKIYGTAPTLNIAEIILRDSARLQEEEAKQANKGSFSKHHPAKPLYNEKDVEATLLHWMSDIQVAPENIFIVHGERQAADTFQVKIRDTFGWQAVVPNLYEIVEIPLNGISIAG